MEYCMELATALKSSLRRRECFPPPLHAPADDFLYHNGADESSVDCFFDFSNDGDQDNIILLQDEEDDEEEEEKDVLSVSSQDRLDDDTHSNFSTFSGSFLDGQLSLPEADDLEWVSHFVDDSLPQFPLLYSFNSAQEKPQPFLTNPSCLFPPKIPVKPRSNRPRLTRRTWLIPESSASSSSSSTLDIFQPPLKKQKTKPASGQSQRRCSHCQVQKTPQWRTGPLGAKTLCNACGVRYKAGRLFPEYRPACSPTFASDVHSNSHGKVVEIRKKKEMGAPESGLVPSFLRL
ncbi:GATA transcription factor 5 [Euphorbia peplus]|nr:GATA transcription factor 5 [Euphorbia peplus]